MLILKLGGSVITDKKRYRTFKRTATENIISQLKPYSNSGIVVVHGGGSFGHIASRKYGLPGALSELTRKGASIVHADMMDLNQSVVKIINRVLGPCLGVPPSTAGSDLTNKIAELAGSGFIPVTFGDVMVEPGRVRIISGDEIMLDLATKFRPDMAIFFSDVDGVYDKDPRLHSDAVLQAEVKIEPEAENSDVIDVTGGMLAKIKAMKRIASVGTNVYLINGYHPDRLKAVGTDKFIGTVFR
ncbi:MAG: isopentenyl phosphate kinase [Thermoplasmataceae archaeon]